MNSNPLQRHSRLGIASFIIALSVGLIIIVLMVGSIAATTLMRNTDTSLKLIISVSIGFAAILAYFGNLIGAGLGIAGILQRERKKVFAIIGLCLNAIGVLVGTLVLIAGFTLRPVSTRHDSDKTVSEMPIQSLEAVGADTPNSQP